MRVLVTKTLFNSATELCPLDFQEKWKLKNHEMAHVLGISPHTYKHWRCREGTNSHNDIPRNYKKHCKALNELWEICGKPDIKAEMKQYF